MAPPRRHGGRHLVDVGDLDALGVKARRAVGGGVGGFEDLIDEPPERTRDLAVVARQPVLRREQLEQAHRRLVQRLAEDRQLLHSGAEPLRAEARRLARAVVGIQAPASTGPYRRAPARAHVEQAPLPRPSSADPAAISGEKAGRNFVAARCSAKEKALLCSASLARPRGFEPLTFGSVAGRADLLKSQLTVRKGALRAQRGQPDGTRRLNQGAARRAAEVRRPTATAVDPRAAHRVAGEAPKRPRAAA